MLIIFLIFSIVQLLSSQSVSNALFSSCLYEAPPSEKHNVLWLVGWSGVLWLVFGKCPAPYHNRQFQHTTN